MKKLILILSAAILSVGVAFAQDVAEATATYNSGAEALQNGDKSTAVLYFKKALSQAQACGEAGAEIVNNCKSAIPSVVLSTAKDAFNDKNFDGALAKIEEAKAAAAEYGAEDVKAEAEELIPTVLMQKANAAFSAKQYADAIDSYKQVVAADTTNGTAAVRLGVALVATGKTDEGVAYLEQAARNGEEKMALKQLSNIFVKKANAANKAQKYTDAIAAADKSNSYIENATAYLIKGTAASKLKKNDAAIEAYEKFLELDPNNKNAAAYTFTLGVLYQQEGLKDKAKEAYTKVLSDAKFGAQAKAALAAIK
ncbi:MAG: tetratricopeptide repeat protein [Bacteroidales bacterium]|nr:tetratricopeptide repeat protein [Bacteroidales bacterium]